MDSQPDSPSASPADWTAESIAWHASELTNTTEALFLLAKSAGVTCDRAAVRAALQVELSHNGKDGGLWGKELLVRAAESLGLRIEQVRLPLAKASRVAHRATPLATWASNPSGCAGWLFLHGRRRRRFVVSFLNGTEQRLREHELRELLGKEQPDDAFPWYVVEPAAPCEPASSRAMLAARDSGPGHHAHLTPLARLLAMLQPDRRDLHTIIIFSIGVGMLTLATPIAVQNLVSTVALGGLLQPVLVLAFLLFVCLGFAAALLALQTYVVEILQRRIFVRVVADLAYRLPRVRYQAFDGQHGPELVNRFFDVLTVQKVAASLLLDGLALVLQTIISMIVLAFYHPYLLGFDLVLIATVVFAIFVLGRGAVRTSIRESLAKYAVAGWLEEMARHPIAFRLGGAAEMALHRADSLTTEYLNARSQHFRVLMRQICFVLGLQAVASTALLGLGGWLVIERQLTLGQLVAAELIVTIIVGSFAKMGKHLEGYYDLMAASDKLGHLIDLPLENARGEVMARTGPAELRINRLFFAYQPHCPVFENLNLHIQAGERVAIVGGTGAGKSTLADLLYGLRVADRGEIKLDGQNIAVLRPDALRRVVAAVRGFEVFQGTIAQNVHLDRHTVRNEDLRWALETVGLLETVDSLPGGVHTQLSTGGAPLTGDQARRLVLARSIAGRPRLLVLDRALDAVNPAEYAEVIRALVERRDLWTLIVFTGRPDVAAWFDRIVPLSDPDGSVTDHSRTTDESLLDHPRITERTNHREQELRDVAITGAPL